MGPITNPERPIGHNKLSDIQKACSQLCGYSNPHRCTSRGLRSFGVTKLVNSSEISETDKLCASRHKSLSSHAHYQRTTDESRDARYMAHGARADFSETLDVPSSSSETSSSTPRPAPFYSQPTPYCPQPTAFYPQLPTPYPAHPPQPFNGVILTPSPFMQYPPSYPPQLSCYQTTVTPGTNVDPGFLDYLISRRLSEKFEDVKNDGAKKFEMKDEN